MVHPDVLWNYSAQEKGSTGIPEPPTHRCYIFEVANILGDGGGDRPRDGAGKDSPTLQQQVKGNNDGFSGQDNSALRMGYFPEWESHLDPLELSVGWEDL